MARLTQYTQTISTPDETYTYTIRVLCEDCRSVLSGLSKMSGVYGTAACDLCGEPTNPQCKACYTQDHPASAIQPGFCTECVQAMLHGRANRFD